MGKKGSMTSSTKTSTTPKKIKRKEKVLKPKEESIEHIDFHLSFESSGDVHSLIILLNGPKRGKRGKHALEHLEVNKYFKTQKEASLKVD
jgi:hypothetical protein